MRRTAFIPSVLMQLVGGVLMLALPGMSYDPFEVLWCIATESGAAVSDAHLQ